MKYRVGSERKSRTGPFSAAAVDALEDRRLFAVTLTTIHTLSDLPSSTETTIFMTGYGKLAVDSAGNLYGATATGGTYGKGSIYEIAAGNHHLTTLYSLTSADGSQISALTLDSSGNLFGYTLDSLFELTAGTHQFITLATDFPEPINEATISYPFGTPTVVDGVVYGETINNESYVQATNVNLFAFTPGVGFTAQSANLDEFNYGEVVANLPVLPVGPLVEDQLHPGMFYCAVGLGSQTFAVDEWDSASQEIQKFNIPAAPSVLPTVTASSGLAVDSAGNIYGSTKSGEVGSSGTLFEITANSHTYGTILSFTQQLPTGVISDAAGDLFGIFTSGQSATLFEVPAGANSFTTLDTFTLASGETPVNQLVADSAGNLYGLMKGSPDSVYEISGTGFQTSATSVVPRSQLVFSQPPGETTATRVIAPVQVTTEDLDSGAVLSTAGSITLTLSNAPAGALLEGTLTEPLVNGVATFSDLAINVAGTYTLTASDAASSPASTSVTIDALPFPPLTLATGKSTLATNIAAGSIARGKVVIDVTNSANAASSGRITLALFADPGGSATAPFILLQVVRPAPKFRPGQTRAVPLSVIIPADLAKQAYSLIAMLTDSAGNVRVFDTGLAFTVSTPFVSLVPSQITDVTTRSGNHIVSFVLSNLGNIVSTKKFGRTYVAYSLTADTALVSRVQKLVLPPGHSHIIRAIIDKSLWDIAVAFGFLQIQVFDSTGVTQVAMIPADPG